MRLIKAIGMFLVGWLIIGSLIDIPLILIFDKTWDIGAWVGIFTGLFLARRELRKRLK